jgi:hypothetical protein
MINWHNDPWFDHFVRHVAMRSGAAAPRSPRLARDRHAPLEFRREAAWYHERVHAQRPPRDRRFIERLADEVSLDAGTRSVSVVPVFAREESLRPLLAEAPAGHHYLLLVNAAQEQLSAAAFAVERSRLRAQVATLQAARPSLRVSFLARHFAARVPVKRIRGLMTDALVLAAARARLDDPIVLFQDADQLAAAPGHQARLRSHLARAPRLDFVAAPVCFGLAPDGRSYLAHETKLPELFLGNRALLAAAAARRAGEGVPPHFISQGANLAFRLASLCAGGGLDYGLWEDAQIGWWTAAMRLGAGRPRYQAAHHRFDEQPYVVTDPRRVLRAILRGQSPEHAWTWEPHERAPVVPNPTTQLASYRRDRGLLQLSDLRRAQAGDERAQRKLHQRVLFHFLAPLSSQTVDWVKALAARFGLAFDGLQNGGAKIRGVRWDQSAIIDDLQRWAAS